jgi:serine protease Do
VIIGIGVQTITPVLAAATGLRRDSGVVISDILPGSPAELAGLKRNDIVLAVDSVPMENLPHLMLAFLVRGGKERLHLEVLRDDQTLSVDVATVEEDHASDRLQDLVNLAKNQIPKLGIVAIAIDKQTEAMFPNLRVRYGVVVTARSPALGATVTDLQVGDVIHEVNGAMVATIEGLREALEPKKRGDPVALFIEREGKLLYVAFEIE